MKVLDFWAPWCPPCKAMKPVVEALEKEFPTVEFVKINIDEQQEIAEQHGVMSIPTMIFQNGDTETGRLTGMATKEQISTFLS